MEVIFELVFEVFGQILFEVVGDSLGSSYDRARREGRWNGVAFGVMAVIGFVGGVIWGNHVQGLHRDGYPRSVMSSAGLALFFAGLALSRRGEPEVPRGLAGAFTPWRWGPMRLWNYAATSVVIAVAIAIGFA